MKLLKTELNRKGEAYAYGLTILLTGNPVGHALDHARCLTVERRVYTTGHLHLTDASIRLNDELNDDSSLNAILLSHSRVVDVAVQIAHQSALTTGE